MSVSPPGSVEGGGERGKRCEYILQWYLLCVLFLECLFLCGCVCGFDLYLSVPKVRLFELGDCSEAHEFQQFRRCWTEALDRENGRPQWFTWEVILGTAMLCFAVRDHSGSLGTRPNRSGITVV